MFIFDFLWEYFIISSGNEGGLFMPETALIKKIEEHRKEMITLSHSHPLTSEQVIASSTKLDQLIMEYLNIRRT